MDGEYFAEGGDDPEPAIAAVTRGLRRGCCEHGIIVSLGIANDVDVSAGCMMRVVMPPLFPNLTEAGRRCCRIQLLFCPP